MQIRNLTQWLAARRDTSALELTRHFLERIERHDRLLNSLITVCAERALQQARAVDATGKPDGLAGLPIVHKDSFCTRGVRTTAASRMLDNFIAPYDAEAVARLDTAGAVTLGKANMDEFAMGSSNVGSFHGPARNPWHADHVPGGSSGGSAVAVAAGLALAATGSDTGGSIRQPAAYCGITGIKPTYGRVSRHGLIAHASSLDHAGCFARSAADCAQILGIMAGVDTKDTTSAERPVPDYARLLDGDIAGVRIGLPLQYLAEPMTEGVRTAIDAAVHQLEQLGATLIDVDLPHTGVAAAAYHVLACAEASSNLARYDGVRYGYRCDAPRDLDDLYLRSRAEGFGDEVKRRILAGTYLLSGTRYQQRYVKAQRVRRLIARDFEHAFEQVDLLAAPTMPATASRLDEVGASAELHQDHSRTIPANLAGIPALSVPAGFADGLPVGLQLLAPWFDEARLLNAAHAFQQATDWHLQQPQGFA